MSPFSALEAQVLTSPQLLLQGEQSALTVACFCSADDDVGGSFYEYLSAITDMQLVNVTLHVGDVTLGVDSHQHDQFRGIVVDVL